MIATAVFPPSMLRATSAFLHMVQTALMAAGLILIVGLAGVHAGNSGFIEGLKSMLPKAALAALADSDDPADEAEAPAPVLSPRMRGALDYVSRRYRVSTEALAPIFATAQAAGKELHLDPLLIVAVIGVESGFNPFSQSSAGAQGLMQVIPRYHLDKLPEDVGTLPFFDPVTNIQVGAKVLKESIRRFGGLEDGLQQFGGALNDQDRRYAARVLAEKQRLEQAALRLRANAA